MLSQSGIEALDRLSLLKRPAPHLASTVTGVIVRDGAPKPDISTPEAFVRAMLAAPSVAWTDPKAGVPAASCSLPCWKGSASLTPSTRGRAVQGGYDVAGAIAEGAPPSAPL